MADRSVVIRLRGEIGDFQAKMVAAGHSVADVASKMTGAEKESQKFRRGLDSLGTVGGRIGLVAAAGLGTAITVAANFDQAMSKVAAATHESAENMAALREAAIQAGADTAFSASEAAAGIENLAKAGVQTQEILGGGLQGALDLAAAGTIDVAEAAETAATAMTQFGLTGKEVPHIADLLAAAAGKAQGEVSDMGMALKQSGLVADQVGLSIEETTGGLAAFASAGLLGSDAGTSFKTMLGALTPNSEKAAGAMESLGIHAYDAGGNFVGLAAFAGSLRDGLKDLTDQQRQATLETIFGSDAVRAASVLYEQGSGGVQDWIDKVNDAGYASETAAIKLDNLKGDLEAFKGSLETALIGVGEGSQGSLRSLVQGATDAVNALNGLPDGAKNAATGLGAITAITGGTLWFGSKVVQGVADTREALDQLGPAGVRAGRMLKGALTGLAILEGLNLLDDAIDAIFDHDLNSSNLIRSLDALASGRITGEMEKVFGDDLSGFGDAMESLTSNWTALSRVSKDIPIVGGFVSGAAGDAIDNIERMDTALAGLVESGQGDQAASAFKQLTDAAADAGFSVKDVREQFVQYQIAVDNARGIKGPGAAIIAPFDTLSGILSTVGTGADAAANGIDGIANTADDAARAVLKLDDVLSELFDGLDLDATVDSWRSSIKALRDDLEGGNSALDRNTEQGQKNREAIRAQLDALRAMAEAQYNANGNTDQLTQTLLKGREAIIQQAIAAGISREAMEKYLKTLGLTPKEIRTTVALMDAPKAEGQLDDLIYKAKILRSELAAMSRTRIDIRARGEGGLDGYATGGYTGNASPSAIAGVVHGREFVFDAQMTAMYRPMFEAMHRTRKVPGYREGGYVAAQSSTTNYYGGSDIDYDRLARAISRVRPMYGDVHVSGDGAFRRELLNDARSSSLDGI